MESCSITELFGEFRRKFCPVILQQIMASQAVDHLYLSMADLCCPRGAIVDLGVLLQVRKDTSLSFTRGDGPAASEHGRGKRKGKNLSLAVLKCLKFWSASQEYCRSVLW